MSDEAVETVELKARPRWWQRRWLLWVATGFVVLGFAGAMAVQWGLRQMQPLLRKKVVETLSARFHSPVELDRLELSMSRDVIVTGGGLRILYLAGPTRPDARPNAPPMLVVDWFEFRTGWRELLRPTTRLVTVKVRGLQLDIPPKQERGQGPDDPKRQGQSALGIVVDRIECTDAKVVLETSKPGKKPLEFAVKSLVLTDVGTKKPLNYTALLVNPKPVGEVRSTGHFGPWQNDEPRDTPFDGDYQFTNADLSSIHGLGGTLSSTGRFGGTLGNLTADGTTETPDFRLDISDHAMPLHTEFHAVVDGTTGDTYLDPVRVRIGRSELTARGAVTRAVGVQGHNTDLSVVMDRGRIEDMLALSMKASPSLMRGTLALKMHLVDPAGPVSISRKVRLDGTFAIHEAFLNDAKKQQQLDTMSERAQGKPKLANAQDAPVVGSSMSGKFSQANAVLQIPELSYQMPGAQVLMNGQVELVGSTFEFHGKVRTEATASQMVTGWKSLLLTPFDKLLKKNGAGVELPIKVTGARSTYDLRLDLPHDTKAPSVVKGPGPAVVK
ncbi:AsmA-like C-terminal region-containing protein [Granulicella sp. S190]|uniref:AsmA-like C-terminal region-containing protein n=1 Tax=Granulicella sp. S190 TaxID=1747226 RepID=UPI00131CDCDB|nr:AsmA-like C-terminal region-containing protein [Granulicella sp. S190]